MAKCGTVSSCAVAALLMFFSGASVVGAKSLNLPRRSATHMLCSTFAAQRGGPDVVCNATTNGYIYTASDDDTCNKSASDCLQRCCSPVNPQQCENWQQNYKGDDGPACGNGFIFTGDGHTCNESGLAESDDYDCQQICCTQTGCIPWYFDNGRDVACGDGYLYRTNQTLSTTCVGDACYDLCCEKA